MINHFETHILFLKTIYTMTSRNETTLISNSKFSKIKQESIFNNKRKNILNKIYLKRKRLGRILSPTQKKTKDKVIIKDPLKRKIISPRNNLTPLFESAEFKRDSILKKRLLKRKINLSNLISDDEIRLIRDEIWAKIHQQNSAPLKMVL